MYDMIKLVFSSGKEVILDRGYEAFKNSWSRALLSNELMSLNGSDGEELLANPANIDYAQNKNP
jgi:hypothetical protein